MVLNLTKRLIDKLRKPLLIIQTRYCSHILLPTSVKTLTYGNFNDDLQQIINQGNFKHTIHYRSNPQSVILKYQVIINRLQLGHTRISHMR